LVDKVAELKKKISILESADPDSPKLQAYKAELTELTGATPATVEGVTEIPGASEEDYDSASASKFAQVGLHLSEFGMPYWKTPGMSIAFPFTITDGADKGKEGEIFTGVGKNALWKLKEILSALDVTMQKTKSGGIGFDFAQVAGKTAQVLWTQQVDSRSLMEGGTGGTYTKPVSVMSVGAAPPESLV